jgi:hypothetical protein
MTHAIHVSSAPCCDRPRPFFNCGGWPELGTPIVYGLCQSCGSFVAACTCGCGGEARLTIDEVQKLSKRWPEQFAQLDALRRRFVITATTIRVPAHKLAMFRLRRRGECSRVERGEPALGAAIAELVTKRDCMESKVRLPGSSGPALPSRPSSQNLIRQLLRPLGRQLHRLATFMMFRADARNPRTTDARGGRAGRAA